MKARFFLCCGLSALFFGACSEDTTTDATPRPNGPGLVFTGITEGGRTRTQLGDKDKNGNYPTQWIAGDRIAVYASDNPKDYAIYKTENGGETLADFIYESGAELNASAPYFVAYYPEKYYNNNYFNQDDKSLEVRLPDTQNYTAGNIEQDAYPMAAVSKGTKLSFKNVLGIVRLNLKSTLGGVKVRKIIISSNKPLWGISSITFGDGATAPILNVNEDEYVDTKNMTLDCGEAGVALNADAPTEFMVTLPPAEYKTFRIQVIDTDNKIQSFTANRTISVARSAITTVNLGINALKSVSTLRHGYIFNYALMRLANNTETPESPDKKIKAIRFVTNSAETSETIVSDETTAVPAYAVWNAETGEMVIHTAADKIMAHTNSSGTFKDMRALTSLDLTGFDTENVTNMNAMFRDSFGLPELDVSKLNTANVTDMSYMFAGSQLKRLDVSGFKTENATNMSGMFYDCFELAELDVSGFKTENVTDMGEMFFNCTAIKSLDVSGFNTEKVTDMHKLFFRCHQLTALDVSGFKTENVTDMNYMFFGCNQLTTLDLSGFKTEKVTNMSDMFGGCCQLKELDLKTFNTANVTDMSGMFSNCEQLTELDVSMFNTEKVGHIWSMFDGCSKLTSLDLKTFNTANVTNMSDMFYDCESLTSLDLSMFNTEKVEFMSRLFRNCYNLTSLNLGTSFTMDLVSNTDEMCCDMASVSGACTVSCIEETENKMKASNKFPTSGISFVRPQ